MINGAPDWQPQSQILLHLRNGGLRLRLAMPLWPFNYSVVLRPTSPAMFPRRSPKLLAVSDCILVGPSTPPTLIRSHAVVCYHGLLHARIIDLYALASSGDRLRRLLRYPEAVLQEHQGRSVHRRLRSSRGREKCCITPASPPLLDGLAHGSIEYIAEQNIPGTSPPPRKNA